MFDNLKHSLVSAKTKIKIIGRKQNRMLDYINTMFPNA